MWISSFALEKNKVNYITTDLNTLLSLRIQGGGMFLSLFTEDYFHTEYCLAELMAFLKTRQNLQPRLQTLVIITFDSPTLQVLNT